MPESVLDQINELDTARASKEAQRLKEIISDAVEDGLRTARRTMKQGQEFAEETMDEALHTVKKYPMQTVAVTFGVALAAGLFLGWLASRDR